jgi:hypothetical protein
VPRLLALVLTLALGLGQVGHQPDGRQQVLRFQCRVVLHGGLEALVSEDPLRVLGWDAFDG